MGLWNYGRKGTHDHEIDRCRRLLPDDLYYDPRYVADNTLWDTWLRDEHDVRRASYFDGTATAGTGGAHTVAFTVSITTFTSSHDEGGGQPHSARHEGLHSATCDVAIPEPMEEEMATFPPELIGALWGWSCTAPEMAQAVGVVKWCPTPPQSLEREASPREEVLQASFQHAPAHQGPSAHLWTPPPYIDLVSDDGGDDTGDQ
ncbi:hypothetical protein D1007_16685 [Hordeum vulgare]|nr:hypothetical protein D1007_38098 [Hordeum vulgare]KAE8807014.1 hypothetical protein D1007_16685 [Hordeum vulgare]